MVKKKKLPARRGGPVAGCQLPVKRMAQVLLLLLAAGHWQLGTAWAQQAQAQQGQPIYAVNAKHVQGVGPGYWPTAGSGLTLNLAAGTAICGNPPAKVDYAGGTLTMTNAATNYVYLDPAASCVPAKNTTGFTAGVIPLAQVVAAGGVITGVTDVRTWFVDPNAFGPVVRADLMPGADAGAKIAACIAALPATGGTVDARGLEGAQTISQDVFSGVTKPVKLLLGDAEFTISATQNIPDNTTLEGLYGGKDSDLETSGPNRGTTFLYAPGFAGPALKVDERQHVLLRGFTIDCNGEAGSVGIVYDNTAGAGHSGNTNRFELFNIYRAEDSAFVFGTGGAGGKDISHSILDRFKINGTSTNTAAKGIAINSIGAGGSSVVSNGEFRRLNRDIDITYTYGAISFRDLNFSDPTGTSPCAIYLGTVLRPLTFQNLEAGSSLSTSYNDVRWRSVCGVAPGTSAILTFIGNNLHFPMRFDAGVHVTSIGNAAAYGPYELNHANADAISIGDRISYDTGSFTGTHIWATLTAYTHGWIIVPTTANGHYYRCSTAGTSAAGEPSWPTGDGGTVGDGTVVWTEVGSHTSNIEPWIARNASSQVFTLREVGTDTARIWPINLTPSGSLLDLVLKNGLSIGTNPATTGNVRLANNATFVARNAANNADLSLIKMDASNRIDLYGGRFLMTTADFSPDAAGTRTLGAVARWGATKVGKLDATYYLGAVNPVTFSSTPTFDVSLGNTQKLTLTGNVTSSTLSNASAGQTINFVICQDATGGRTFVWPTNFLNAPSINSGPNQCKGASFVFDGTNGVHLE
jgi:hypothetical protein